MPMSASEVVGIETRNPEGGCYLVKAGGSGSGSGYSGHCADEVGGFSPGASTSSSHQPQPHHFNVQESTLVISNSSTCTLKLQSSSGPFSSKTKNYTVQFNKETTKTTTSSQVTEKKVIYHECSVTISYSIPLNFGMSNLLLSLSKLLEEVSYFLIINSK